MALVQDPGRQGSGPLLLHLPQKDLGSQLRRRNPYPGLDLGIAVGEFRLEPGLPGCELHGHLLGAITGGAGMSLGEDR